MRASATRDPQFTVSDVRSRLAVTTARLVSRSSRLWRQRGLGTIFLKLNALRAFRGTECTVEFERDCRFTLPVFEPYWGPTVVGGRPYEEEVVHVLDGVRDLGATFIDCGANWGYYSVLVTRPGFGYRGGIAIEANPPTFARLRENARVNDERFVCLANAVGARSGERVTLGHTDHHAVAYVRTDGVKGGVDVETITIDDAIERAGFGDRERFVVKIDVEGQELAALEGARRMRANKDHLIVYEDWTRLGFSTTAALMADGQPIFYVRTDGRCVAIPRIEDALDIIAADGPVSRPCNFVAVKRDGAFHARLTEWARR